MWRHFYENRNNDCRISLFGLTQMVRTEKANRFAGELAMSVSLK